MRAPRGAPTARLACVRPAASVHPEPGSNSPLDMIVSTTFSSVPAAPGPPGPGPAGPSHRHAPTNAAPPGPPLFFRPPSRPESEREGSAPAPNRQAPPRNFSDPWAQGPGGQREKFLPKGEIFPRRRAAGAFTGGLGGRRRGHRYAFGEHGGGTISRVSQERSTLRTDGSTAVQKKCPPAPLWGRRTLQWANRATYGQRPANPGLRRL